MASLALMDFIPVLTFIGAFSLVMLALVVGFWPWIESPLIAFFVGVRDWRAHRRRCRDLRKALWKLKKWGQRR